MENFEATKNFRGLLRILGSKEFWGYEEFSSLERILNLTNNFEAYVWGREDGVLRFVTIVCENYTNSAMMGGGLKS